MENHEENQTPIEPTPEALLQAPDATAVLDQFNNLVDELEEAEQRLAEKNETLDAAKSAAKEAQAEVNQILIALRGKAREMRRGPQELPLFDGGVQ